MKADTNTFGLRIVTELPWFFVGLDLGQSRDHSALAVVEPGGRWRGGAR